MGYIFPIHSLKVCSLDHYSVCSHKTSSAKNILLHNYNDTCTCELRCKTLLVHSNMVIAMKHYITPKQNM